MEMWIVEFEDFEGESFVVEGGVGDGRRKSYCGEMVEGD